MNAKERRIADAKAGLKQALTDLAATNDQSRTTQALAKPKEKTAKREVLRRIILKSPSRS